MDPEISRRPSLNLHGRGYILFVVAYLALASAFFLFTSIHSVARWGDGKRELFWVAGELIRAGSASLVTVLLWRYAKAIERHKTHMESSRLERAHLSLWKWSAMLLAINLAYLSLVAARPSIQLPVPEPESRSTEK